MVKQAYNKGFTLMEMLLVLFMLSMLIAIFPFVKPQKNIQFGYEMYTIKAMIQETQIASLRTHVSQEITISPTHVNYLNHSYTLQKGMTCLPQSVRFAQNGNVTQAKTITCSCGTAQKKIVVELGSGCMYVR